MDKRLNAGNVRPCRAHGGEGEGGDGRRPPLGCAAAGQGLTLVLLSAQLEPFVTQNTP